MTKFRKIKIGFRIVLATLSLVVAGFLSYSTAIKIADTVGMYNQLESVTMTRDNLESEKADLEEEVANLQDESYLTQYAREHYVFLKDGEQVSIIPDMDDE